MRHSDDPAKLYDIPSVVDFARDIIDMQQRIEDLETDNARLGGKLAALEDAAKDAISKIDDAADRRINFRRDFAMRLRQAMGMGLPNGDWSDPR